MKRREFIPVATAAPWAAALPAQSPKGRLATSEWRPRLAESLVTVDDATLRWVAQLGIEWVSLRETESLAIARESSWSVWQIEDLQKRLSAFGLRLHSLRLPAVWLNPPRTWQDDIDRAIENVRTCLTVAGEAGVAVVEWPWSVEVRWGSNSVGSETLNRLFYFANRVMGAAEQAGVKMSLCPMPAYSTPVGGRLAVFSESQELESFFDAVPSPANGFTVSHSTIEGLGVEFDKVIRQLGPKGRIHHVQMRTAFPGNSSDGVRWDPDGLEVMRACKECGYDLAIVSDHAGEFATDVRETRIGCSFSHGYLRGLLQVVNA